jgi:hypothetical protein
MPDVSKERSGLLVMRSHIAEELRPKHHDLCVSVPLEFDVESLGD